MLLIFSLCVFLRVQELLHPNPLGLGRVQRNFFFLYV